MVIKRGSFVRHGDMQDWGTGKVMDVADFNATIQFSDGVTRKIASSHYGVLVAGDPATFVASEATVPEVIKPVARRAKKKPLAAPAT